MMANGPPSEKFSPPGWNLWLGHWLWERHFPMSEEVVPRDSLALSCTMAEFPSQDLMQIGFYGSKRNTFSDEVSWSLCVVWAWKLPTHSPHSDNKLPTHSPQYYTVMVNCWLIHHSVIANCWLIHHSVIANCWLIHRTVRVLT